jgi:hypothetical protein
LQPGESEHSELKALNRLNSLSPKQFDEEREQSYQTVAEIMQSDGLMKTFLTRMRSTSNQKLAARIDCDGDPLKK